MVQFLYILNREIQHQIKMSEMVKFTPQTPQESHPSQRHYELEAGIVAISVNCRNGHKLKNSFYIHNQPKVLYYTNCTLLVALCLAKHPIQTHAFETEGVHMPQRCPTAYRPR